MRSGIEIYKRGQQTAPVRANEFGDSSIDFEQGDSFEQYEDGFLEPVTASYYESECETTAVRSCGACCCVLLGVLILSWVVHAIPVSTVTDIPPFARSMIWMSIAHHTEPWQAAKQGHSPPPPAFGDGLGNFPD